MTFIPTITGDNEDDFRRFVAITFPTALTGAILPLGALAGTATAFIGSTQNLGRGFFSSLLGSLHPQSVMPLAIMISILSSLCLLISGYKYFKAEAVV